MDEEFLSEQKQFLEENLQYAVKAASYIRTMVLKQAEKLNEQDRANLTKILGSYGQSGDISQRVVFNFYDQLVDFLNDYAKTLYAEDERLHDCLWLLGRENVDELEEAFVNDGKADIKDAIHEGIFTFEDIPWLDDSEVQKLLRETERLQLIHALLGASEAVKTKIFRNMSKRAAALLQDDLRFFEKKASKRRIIASQNKILATIQHLMDIGEISIWELAEKDW